MAMNVRETLLHYPEDRKFHFLRHAPEVDGYVEFYFDFAAFGEPFDIPTKSRKETHLIQQRRMQ